jgi:molybdate transport system regulatory protein
MDKGKGKGMGIGKEKHSKKALDSALGHAAADKRIDILRRIREVGSISQAARDAGISYKAAWHALETLGNLAGAALIEKAVGGSGGGGARLTAAGEQLLEASARMQAMKDQVLQQFARQQGALPALETLQRLNLRTSMRNQLPAVVTRVPKRGDAVAVQLRLAGGQLLVSRITRESAQLLGLAEKLELVVLCKAAAVRIAASVKPPAGGNLLEGIVTRVGTAKDETEVTLALSGGLQLVGFAARGHGLKPGHPAQALVDASSLVLAL